MFWEMHIAHLIFSGRVPSRSQVAASPEAEAEVVRDSVDSHVEVNWFYMFVGNWDPWPALAIGEMFRHHAASVVQSLFLFLL